MLFHNQVINPKSNVMKRILTLLLALLPLMIYTQNFSTQVYPNPGSGELVYAEDSVGNRIPDFSGAGYMGGGVAIPDLPIVMTISPLGDGQDDLAQIQAAIDAVGATVPLDANGLRGAVLLSAGVYEISGPIVLKIPGIVLRGEGNCDDGTIIIHRGTDVEQSIRLFATGHTVEQRATITSGYVPVGGKKIKVSTTDGLEVGDFIKVNISHTQKWIDDIKLASFWNAANFEMEWEREIVSISNDTITLDLGVTSQIDTTRGYASGTIEEIVSDNRSANIGVEDLVLMSDYDRSVTDPEGRFIDEEHANIGIYVIGGSDFWVRRITGYFYSLNLVQTRGPSHRITVEDCAMLDGVSTDNLGRHVGTRDYSFSLSGRKALVQRSYSRNARHSFIINNVTATSNVFLDCYSDFEHLSLEPHQGFSTGNLFDNVRTDGQFKLNRVEGNHGQRAGNSVLWNIKSDNQRSGNYDIELDAAPNGLANNWVIGVINNGTGLGIGTPGAEGTYGEPGFVESVGELVAPRSLYFAQLRDRLGDSAVINVASPEQYISGQAVWDKMTNHYNLIPEFGDPNDLSWMPSCEKINVCGTSYNDPATIKNGAFEETLMCPWIFMNNGDSSSADIINGQMVIDIESSGSNTWEPQLIQDGFALESGLTYKLTFEAKASRPMNFEIQVNSGPSAYTKFLIDKVRLVPAMKTKTFYFTPEESDDNARLDFNFGGNSNKVVTLDKVVLEVSTHQDEQPMHAKVLLYPNPTRGQLTVRLHHHNNGAISLPIVIRNGIGQVVYETVITGDAILDIAHLDRGIYYVAVGGKTRRIIKL
ncbi:hypothetical protein LCGC14_1015560 [marine sediment metagenome]|uniref:CBM-cenC domain-containing protein n=1 Tax=marine sediment metagenome TaxID=412755 RepID=A0A0F9MYX8_9ZZZZ